jgi:hypothetical protein
MRQLPRLNDDPTQLLAQALPDEELVHRARSLLRWKCRFDSVQVAAQAGRVTLSGDLGLPDISGVGDDLGPLAVADLNGPAEGDVQVGEGDPADAFITANFDSGDVGVGDGLASLPVDVGGLGDLGGLGDALDVDLPV